jgi:hypothetical protein
MSVMSSATRVIAVAAVAVGLAAAPVAAADPSDLVPTCTGDQTPQQDNCRTDCLEGAPVTSYGTCSEPGMVQNDSSATDQLPSSSSGADPNVTIGPQGG